jgi:histidinol-phosphate aminotransferase
MEIKDLVRKNILNLKPYTSARDIYEGDKGILLDANENSWGSTFTSIDNLHLNRYPDPHQKDLRQLIENVLSIPHENLFFGVGSDEIIDLLIRVFCNPGKDKVLIPEPTYGMYKVACDINDVETIEVLLDDNFQIDLNVIRASYTENTKIFFLCSPNNPTGNLLMKQDVLQLCKEFNSIIIIDEAYIDFAIEGSFIDEIKNYPNLIVLRTFSKAWGLAGIRLGYCAANEEIINLLFKVKAPYNINSLTRYALEISLRNLELKEKYIKGIIKERERLKNLLESLPGIANVFNSDANFLLVKFNDSTDRNKKAKAVLTKLAERGIIVRDRSTQPKLKNCLRISIGNEEENDLLWDTIKKII